MKQEKEFLKFIERLRLEYEELKALRDAMNDLRNFKEKLLEDRRFD